MSMTLLLVGEAHLDVDLREFRLTVGAEVLVAEAARDLDSSVSKPASIMQNCL